MTQDTLNQIIEEISKSELTKDELTQVKSSIEESKGSMTEEQYTAILSALNKAQESTRPFTVVTNDTLAVVGDANDTKVNKYTYEIDFTHPEYDDDGNITGEKRETKTYKNVYIKPRQQSRITKIIVTLLPFFRKTDEEGNITQYTPYELATIFSTLDESIYDIMYDLVAYVLGVPEEEKDYMELASVVKATLRFFLDFPEAVNEAESFFE